MNAAFEKSIRFVSLICALLMLAPCLCGQTGGKQGLPVVEGKVCDSQGHPLAGVVLSLESADPSRTAVSTTDLQGRFRFEVATVGTYALRAKREGYQEGYEGPFFLHPQEAKSITVLLTKNLQTGAANDASNALEFSDEPAFTVAGVTDTTALGGHGSGQILRSTNALVKDTASLAREGNSQTTAASHNPEHDGTSGELLIRAALAREDTADLHAQLAE